MAKVIKPSQENVAELMKLIGQRSELGAQIEYLNVKIDLVTEKILRQARISRPNAVLNYEQATNEFQVRDK